MIARLATAYLIRFRWEILFYFLVSLGATSTILTAPTGQLPTYLSWLELLALAWVTVRLVLAEDLLRMNGGWRTRPITASQLRRARVIVITSVGLAPVIVRMIILHIYLDPQAAVWIGRMLGPYALASLPALAIFTLFSHLLYRGFQSRRATMTIGLLTFIVLPAIFLGILSRLPGYSYRGGSASPNSQMMLRGIADWLPPSSDRIGDWTPPTGQGAAPRARLVTRIALDAPGATAGLRVASVRSSIQGPRASVYVRVITEKAGTLWDNRTIVVIRYAGEIYSPCRPNARFRRLRYSIPFAGLNEYTFAGTFVSPLSLPESEVAAEDILKGAELLFFEADQTLPPLSSDGGETAQASFDPPPHASSSPDEPTDYVRRLLNWAEPEFRPKSEIARVQSTAKSLHPRYLAAFLDTYPWTNNGWTRVVRPFLAEQLGPRDLPLLAMRMEGDIRLPSLLCEKGWDEQAMPLLLPLAKDRVMLDRWCLKTLAEKRDPSLADDLAAIALEVDENLLSITPLLRESPGFDWSAFVREGWKRAKYSPNIGNLPHAKHFALWAASDGDASALRHLARIALHPETAAEGRFLALSSLLAEQPSDLEVYLRQNLDRLTFDPASGKWR